ncbi:hypothetical protein JL721_9229 [Aureococcus anophagefferens]|nr:hypothetical protein JL721_9229 [Aureococcus anophagefferens]
MAALPLDHPNRKVRVTNENGRRVVTWNGERGLPGRTEGNGGCDFRRCSETEVAYLFNVLEARGVEAIAFAKARSGDAESQRVFTDRFAAAAFEAAVRASQPAPASGEDRSAGSAGSVLYRFGDSTAEYDGSTMCQLKRWGKLRWRLEKAIKDDDVDAVRTIAKLMAHDRQGTHRRALGNGSHSIPIQSFYRARGATQMTLEPFAIMLSAEDDSRRTHLLLGQFPYEQRALDKLVKEKKKKVLNTERTCGHTCGGEGIDPHDKKVKPRNLFYAVILKRVATWKKTMAKKHALRMAQDPAYAARVAEQERRKARLPTDGQLKRAAERLRRKEQKDQRAAERLRREQKRAAERLRREQCAAGRANLTQRCKDIARAVDGRGEHAFREVQSVEEETRSEDEICADDDGELAAAGSDGAEDEDAEDDGAESGEDEGAEDEAPRRRLPGRRARRRLHGPRRRRRARRPSAQRGGRDAAAATLRGRDDMDLGQGAFPTASPAPPSRAAPSAARRRPVRWRGSGPRRGDALRGRDDMDLGQGAFPDGEPGAAFTGRALGGDAPGDPSAAQRQRATRRRRRRRGDAILGRRRGRRRTAFASGGGGAFRVRGAPGDRRGSGSAPGPAAAATATAASMGQGAFPDGERAAFEGGGGGAFRVRGAPGDPSAAARARAPAGRRGDDGDAILGQGAAAGGEPGAFASGGGGAFRVRGAPGDRRGARQRRQGQRRRRAAAAASMGQGAFPDGERAAFEGGGGGAFRVRGAPGDPSAAARAAAAAGQRRLRRRGDAILGQGAAAGGEPGAGLAGWGLDGGDVPGAGLLALRAAAAAGQSGAFDDDDADEWRTKGPHVGWWVTRSVHDAASEVVSFSVGKVVGYLSAAESDYVDDKGAAAALWRVTYVSGELLGDIDDLDERDLFASVLRPTRREGANQQPAPLSEYELHRRGRIDANQAELQSLGFTGSDVGLPKEEKKKRAPRKKAEPAAPSRWSPRSGSTHVPGRYLDDGGRKKAMAKKADGAAPGAPGAGFQDPPAADAPASGGGDDVGFPEADEEEDDVRFAAAEEEDDDDGSPLDDGDDDVDDGPRVPMDPYACFRRGIYQEVKAQILKDNPELSLTDARPLIQERILALWKDADQALVAELVWREELEVKAMPGDKRGRNRHRRLNRAAATEAVEDANPDIAGKKKNDAVEAELSRLWNALLDDEKIEHVVAAGEAQNAEAARMAEEPDGEPEPKRKRPAPVPRSVVQRSVADFKLVKLNFYAFFMQENRAAVEAEVDGDAANTGKTHKELVKTKLEENFRALDDFAKAQWRKDASVFYYFCGQNLERIIEDVEDVASAATWERLVKEKLAEAWRALDDGAKAALAQGAADAAPVPAEPRAARALRPAPAQRAADGAAGLAPPPRAVATPQAPRAVFVAPPPGLTPPPGFGPQPPLPPPLAPPPAPGHAAAPAAPGRAGARSRSAGCAAGRRARRRPASAAGRRGPAGAGAAARQRNGNRNADVLRRDLERLGPGGVLRLDIGLGVFCLACGKYVAAPLVKNDAANTTILDIVDRHVGGFGHIDKAERFAAAPAAAAPTPAPVAAALPALAAVAMDAESTDAPLLGLTPLAAAAVSGLPVVPSSPEALPASKRRASDAGSVVAARRNELTPGRDRAAAAASDKNRVGGIVAGEADDDSDDDSDDAPAAAGAGRRRITVR